MAKAKATTKAKPKPKTVTKTCLACPPESAEHPLSAFYMSRNPFHKDGKVPWCKGCILKYSLRETGEIDIDKFKNVLRQLDKPYYKDVLQSSIKQFVKEHPNVPAENIQYHGKEIVGLYFKNINTLRQLSARSYGDSEADDFVYNEALRNTGMVGHDEAIQEVTNEKARKMNKLKEKVYKTSNNDSFKVTDEIIQLFGEGYSKDEYRKMYNKYEKIKMNYTLQTNLHQEALATYVRFKVKEEDATARGDVDKAKKWYDAAQNAASNGKLTPKQLSDADLQGGLNTFSDIFKAVEQAVDVIPILPRFKYRPNDALDFNIWCYINYARDLEGKPPCSYEDVYKFYDKKKQEYLDQYGDPYGIFDDEPDESLRENIKKFITLPKNYMEGDE